MSDPCPSTGLQASANRIWGTIYGNNMKLRAYYESGKGEEGEPWYVSEDGRHWSAFDVRFVPDAGDEPNVRISYGAKKD